MRYLYDSTGIGDALNRVSAIAGDAAGVDTHASYTYQGAGTVTSTARPEVTGGMTLDYDPAGDNSLTGWDRFGRVTDHAWRDDLSTVLDGYGYTYDDAGNRTSKSNLDNAAFDETYTFDELDRLVDADRNGVNLQSWSLDQLGNWDSTTRGTSTAETRDHNKANEITAIGSTSPITYDAAGNMTADATQSYIYDAWNRLVEVQDLSSVTIATYEYDGRNYRIQRVIGTDTFDDYHNDGWQLLQTDLDGTLHEQYIYGLRYIDAVVLRDRDTTGDGTLDETLYYTQDAQFNVTALIDTTGTVVERYAYTPYGEQTVLDADWSADADGVSDVANAVSYTGQRLDAESGLHQFRNRFYSAELGRFVSRDPLAFIDGPHAYQFVRSSPMTSVDPLGLQASGASDTRDPDRPSIPDFPGRGQLNPRINWGGPFTAPGTNPNRGPNGELNPLTGARHNPKIGLYGPAYTFDGNEWVESRANWDDASGSLHRTYHEVSLCFDKRKHGDINGLADRIFDDMQGFVGFDRANGYAGSGLAQVQLVRPNFARFDTLGRMGIMSDFLNDEEVGVILYADADTRILRGVTTPGHMLAGVREWRVEVQEHGDTAVVTLATEAYEYRSGVLNNFGSETNGCLDDWAYREAYTWSFISNPPLTVALLPFPQTDPQLQIWSRYLNELASPYEMENGFRSSESGWSEESITGPHPWRDTLPSDLR